MEFFELCQEMRKCSAGDMATDEQLHRDAKIILDLHKIVDSRRLEIKQLDAERKSQPGHLNNRHLNDRAYSIEWNIERQDEELEHMVQHYHLHHLNLLRRA